MHGGQEDSSWPQQWCGGGPALPYQQDSEPLDKGHARPPQTLGQCPTVYPFSHLEESAACQCTGAASLKLPVNNKNWIDIHVNNTDIFISMLKAFYLRATSNVLRRCGPYHSSKFQGNILCNSTRHLLGVRQKQQQQLTELQMFLKVQMKMPQFLGSTRDISKVDSVQVKHDDKK